MPKLKNQNATYLIYLPVGVEAVPILGTFPNGVNAFQHLLGGHQLQVRRDMKPILLLVLVILQNFGAGLLQHLFDLGQCGLDFIGRGYYTKE